jgi:hypothetical protein
MTSHPTNAPLTPQDPLTLEELDKICEWPDGCSGEAFREYMRTEVERLLATRLAPLVEAAKEIIDAYRDVEKSGDMTIRSERSILRYTRAIQELTTVLARYDTKGEPR